MQQRKYFGTDGIRGHVGMSNINPEFVLKLGWAVGRVLANGKRSRVLIGKDTRVSGYMLESALEAGLSAAGVDVRLLGPMPTPGIAYLTQTLHAQAGIVISASHNLFEDNGIKFFDSNGCKLPDQMELLIEDEIDKPMQLVSSCNLGKANRINDAAGRYIEFCKSTIPSLTRLTGLKIVVDCANGATYHIAPNVLMELGADVVSVGVKPDGFNINQNCGSTAPKLLQETVLASGADVGIGLDGDGDRLIMVDASGELLNGDQILHIVAMDRHQRGLLHGGVVGTLMSNYGLEKALADLHIPFVRANVGDRYVLDLLKKHQWKIGGESSGHIVCLDKTTTGDGIIVALQVLALMVKQNKTLAMLNQGLTLLPQTLLNLKTNNSEQLMQNSKVQRMVSDLNKKLCGSGRVLLRPSGTEPLIRVMVEGVDAHQVELDAKKLLEDIQSIDSEI